MAMWFGRKKTEQAPDATVDSNSRDSEQEVGGGIAAQPPEAPAKSRQPPIRPQSEKPAEDGATATPHRAPPDGDEAPGYLAAAQQPKALYKQLMNSFYDAILIADNKGHIVDSNHRTVEFFGLSTEDLWDMPASKMIAGLNEAVYERIRRAIGSDRFVLMNTWCVRKDGSRFPAEVGIGVVSLLGQDNFVFTVRNVERRIAQLRSLRSGQNAYMNSQAGCFLCDANQNIVTANNAFLSLLRLPSKDPVAGVPIRHVLPDVPQYFERVTGGESVTLEGTGPDKITPFIIQLAPNRQGTAQIDGVVGSLLPKPVE